MVVCRHRLNGGERRPKTSPVTTPAQRQARISHGRDRDLARTTPTRRQGRVQCPDNATKSGKFPAQYGCSAPARRTIGDDTAAVATTLADEEALEVAVAADNRQHLPDETRSRRALSTADQLVTPSRSPRIHTQEWEPVCVGHLVIKLAFNPSI